VGHINGGFVGKWGLNVKLWVRDPQKAHLCAEERILVFFCVKVGAGVLPVGDWKNPQKRKHSPRQMVRKNAHAQKRNPLSDLHKIKEFCAGGLNNSNNNNANNQDSVYGAIIIT